MTLRDRLTEIVENAFIQTGFEAKYAILTTSDRPDLGQFQCNGAFNVAKLNRTNPNLVANKIIEKLPVAGIFSRVSVAGAGFINLTLEDSFLAEYLTEIYHQEKPGVNPTASPKTIILDYGGPNVGKPLHVGHIRSCIIGECLKRVARYLGHTVISDVHLGDWGLQMGMIISQLAEEHPDWVYFQENFVGEYPQESPLDFEHFEQTYPVASKKAKENPEFLEKSRLATRKLQEKHPGYIALWKHFLKISVEDMKSSYDKLFVDFDLWKGESDVQEMIPAMVNQWKELGFTRESDGALIIDLVEETDQEPFPPLIIYKSDGSSLYATTDLATIVQRIADFNPSEIWYVTDMRQSLHFKQVFRCAKKTGIASENIQFCYAGFGTMNGTDGKPFKTREGGVMKLRDLIDMIERKALSRIEEVKLDSCYSIEEKSQIAHLIGVAALKFADLMNYRTKDYIFDLDKFSSFEGKTGTYLLYATVRIKSILKKATESGISLDLCKILSAESASQRDLQLALTDFSETLHKAMEDKAPNYICDYLYTVASCFNRFYHEHRILTEKDKLKKESWLALLHLTHRILEQGLHVLGILVPERL